MKKMKFEHLFLTIYELSLSIIILGKDRVAVVVFAVAAKFVMDIYLNIYIQILKYIHWHTKTQII